MRYYVANICIPNHIYLHMHSATAGGSIYSALYKNGNSVLLTSYACIDGTTHYLKEGIAYF